MLCFRDVAVEPATEMDRVFARGGPVWPDWETQTYARTCRGRVPQDRRPVPGEGPVERIERPCVWGGQVFGHFGHFMAEFATRLPQSLAERPEDLYLFLLPPGRTEREVPGFFRAVLDWHGLPREQVRFVAGDRLEVAELRVAAQGEQLPDVGPTPDYLELLGATWAAKGLEPVPDAYVYVTRSELYPGHGHHAGEAYLADCLRKAGVTVIAPERMSLPEQMRVYLGARHLIFAEGSALHGRQLVGRAEQRITVLNRRAGKRTGRAMLAARAKRGVIYLDRLLGEIVLPMPDGRPRAQSALSLLDAEALVAAFARFGVDLRPVWDDAAHEAALREDLAA